MTPEEFAIAAACGACMHHQPCMARRADLFRAALRERDAAWKTAVENLQGAARKATDAARDVDVTAGPAADTLEDALNELVFAFGSRPLRALLEEAGK